MKCSCSEFMLSYYLLLVGQTRPYPDQSMPLPSFRKTTQWLFMKVRLINLRFPFKWAIPRAARRGVSLGLWAMVNVGGCGRCVDISVEHHQYIYNIVGPSQHANYYYYLCLFLQLEFIHLLFQETFGLEMYFVKKRKSNDSSRLACCTGLGHQH